jgi:hypothetical protein
MIMNKERTNQSGDQQENQATSNDSKHQNPFKEPIPVKENTDSAEEEA